VSEGNYTCPNCGAVAAWEGELPEDCLRCGKPISKAAEDRGPCQRVGDDPGSAPRGASANSGSPLKGSGREVMAAIIQEERPRPPVTNRCAVCDRKEPGLRYWIVSPRGIEHHAADYGMTVCGKDATSPKWWWPL
jgi:hypothetical protein